MDNFSIKMKGFNAVGGKALRFVGYRSTNHHTIGSLATVHSYCLYQTEWDEWYELSFQDKVLELQLADEAGCKVEL